MPWTSILFENNTVPKDLDFEKSGKYNKSYSEVINDTLDQLLSFDESIFCMGQGINDNNGLFGTTKGLLDKYGSKRVFDTPISENGLMGIAIGAAITGLKPIYMHNRPDFLFLAFDQIFNHAAKWHFMFGGKVNVPLVIWSVIGRGWGSAAQHSQAPHGLFMQIPGIKIVMPSNPYDSKGLLVSSVADNNPVFFLEHRWCFNQRADVPDYLYKIPLGKGVIRKKGTDITIIAISYMVIEALGASKELEEEGIDAEIIDLRTLNPLDEELIISSVKKTGRAVVVDCGSEIAGASAEIVTIISEKCFGYLKTPVKRIGLLNTPTPAASVLEDLYYPDKSRIIRTVRKILEYTNK